MFDPTPLLLMLRLRDEGDGDEGRDMLQRGDTDSEESTCGQGFVGAKLHPSRMTLKFLMSLFQCFHS